MNTPDAAQVLTLIEGRTAYVLNQARRALETLLAEGESNELVAESTRLHLKLTSSRIDSRGFAPLTVRDLEQYATVWRNLVPAETEARAALIGLLLAKYPFAPKDCPNLRAALRLEDANLPKFDYPSQTPFEPVDPGDVFKQIEPLLEYVSLSRGETLFRQGDAGDAMYVVVYGRLRVTQKDERGAERTLGYLTRGSSMGEIALLSGEARTASLFALRDCLLIKLSKATFFRLADQYPRLILEMTRGLAERLRARDRNETYEGVRTIAFLPLSAAIDMSAFMRELTAALTPYGAHLHVNSANVNRLTGIGSHLESDLAPGAIAWLNEQESRSRFILYECDAAPTSWTARALRQADRIVLVARASDAPERSAAERQFIPLDNPLAAVRTELVLLHSDNRIAGTQSWLAARPVDRHYHIKHIHAAELGRLARAIAGRSVGLVFGAGGTRTFAVTGVVRALAEAGIRADLVGGTSAGSIAAALMAVGLDWQQMYDAAKEVFSNFRDYTLPLSAVLSGKRVTLVLRRLFGEQRIEDLPLDFFCVSTNLTEAEQVVHRQGVLAQALRASCSLPGVFPPVMLDGNLLCDGAVFNHVPIDLMYERCEGGQVIVIDVGADLGRTGKYTHGEYVNGWRVLAAKILPFLGKGYRAPSLMGTISRATLVGSIRNKVNNLHKASLYLNPPLKDFGLFNLEDAPKLAELGYAYASEQIKVWQHG